MTWKCGRLQIISRIYNDHIKRNAKIDKKIIFMEVYILNDATPLVFDLKQNTFYVTPILLERQKY